MHLGKYSISDDSVIGFWFVANKTMHCITNMGVVTLVDCVIYIYITKLLLLLRVQNMVTTSCRLGNVCHVCNYRKWACRMPCQNEITTNNTCAS